MDQMGRRPLHTRGQWLAFSLVLAGVAIVLPLLNVLTEPDSAWHVPNYLIPLFGKYLCFAMVALALDLIWGFTGILSLGHGTFFAVGGYAMGMYLMRAIGKEGVYASDLPDFMVFLDWKELPWYWYGFDHFWFAAVMALLVPSVLAFGFGWLAFRSRITGVYFSIVTQAMTFAFMLLFFRNDTGFRWQQRPDRLQENPGLSHSRGVNANGSLSGKRTGPDRGVPALSPDRALEIRSFADRYSGR